MSERDGTTPADIEIAPGDSPQWLRDLLAVATSACIIGGAAVAVLGPVFFGLSTVKAYLIFAILLAIGNHLKTELLKAKVGIGAFNSHFWLDESGKPVNDSR